MKVIIIGSGIAGLASAVRMAVRGYEVEVFEANAYPGGKITSFEKEGFRFDAGPSLFTWPHLIDELFLLAGKDPKMHFPYRRNEIIANYFFEDGTILHAYADKFKLAEEFSVKLNIEGQIILDHLQNAEKIYTSAGKIFLEKSLHRAGTWFSKDVLKALSKFRALHVLTTMHSVNQKNLKHRHLVQYFDRYATYNGSSPYAAPGILNMIAHLEHNDGSFFPETGMQQITNSLFTLAKSLSVKFHFHSRVTGIKTTNNGETGVFVKDEFHAADRIICNMDVAYAYQYLLKDESRSKKVRQQERSGSALIFYWGMKKQFPRLHLHNIFFSDDYKNEFEHLFTKKLIADDPTVYINITSKEKKDDAPQGCENWFVMVNAPANENQDWDKIIAFTRQNIITKLSRMLNTDITRLIQTEEILDPRSIESRTLSYKGALYGTSSNSKMAAFLRHPNYSKTHKNIYFCGGSVHPGGGIPLCLLSAKIVDELMHKQ